MCGRYLVTSPADTLLDEFGLDAVPPGVELGPRYNVAPSQGVPVVGVKRDGSTRGLVLMKWGFVPRWAKSPQAGPRPINAKAETAADNPAFRDSFRMRRCLIPADGFYEWERRGKAKQPYWFRPASGRPVAFAGLWDLWAAPGEEPLYTCAILTVPANATVEPCHDRMPAIVPRKHYSAWLDPRTPAAEVAEMLSPAGDALLARVKVSAAVNSAKYDAPDCVAEVAEVNSL